MRVYIYVYKYRNIDICMCIHECIYICIGTYVCMRWDL